MSVLQPVMTLCDYHSIKWQVHRRSPALLGAGYDMKPGFAGIIDKDAEIITAPDQQLGRDVWLVIPPGELARGARQAPVRC